MVHVRRPGWAAPCSPNRVVAHLREVGIRAVQFLVHGAVVVSADYFKTFIAGLRNLFGGRFRSYETLMERARREALLRLKADARRKGAKTVICVRFETTSISTGWAPAMEVLAYGTALVPDDGSLLLPEPRAGASRLLGDGLVRTPG